MRTTFDGPEGEPQAIRAQMLADAIDRGEDTSRWSIQELNELSIVRGMRSREVDSLVATYVIAGSYMFPAPGEEEEISEREALGAFLHAFPEFEGWMIEREERLSRARGKRRSTK